MYECMYVCINVNMYVCINVNMYVCMYKCEYVCMNIHVNCVQIKLKESKIKILTSLFHFTSLRFCFTLLCFTSIYITSLHFTSNLGLSW